MKTIFVIALVLVVIEFTAGQYYDRSGSCPPATPINVCYEECGRDSQCEAGKKCCPTSCGGFACTEAIVNSGRNVVKPGACPSVPEGPWVCTSRCSTDGDCRRNLKCCPNRCGASACIAPEA